MMSLGEITINKCDQTFCLTTSLQLLFNKFKNDFLILFQSLQYFITKYYNFWNTDILHYIFYNTEIILY